MDIILMLSRYATPAWGAGVQLKNVYLHKIGGHSEFSENQQRTKDQHK